MTGTLRACHRTVLDICKGKLELISAEQCLVKKLLKLRLRRGYPKMESLAYEDQAWGL